MRKITSNCHPQMFRFLHLQTWVDELIWLVSPYCIVFSISFCLYRACFTHLISSHLSCNLCLWSYDQLVHSDKEINANVYRHSLWSIVNVSTVHLNGIWHLIWRYLSKPVLGGHPVLSGHYIIPRGWPLNTGFTVCKYFVNNYQSEVWADVSYPGNKLIYSVWVGLLNFEKIITIIVIIIIIIIIIIIVIIY